ncbi:MAG TPA: substrate-binding domain-containing protein [Nocardioidaceae bacterium]|nr:substrate-binding domain-containing protein [Nocardioidaceae bacterium]
MRIGLVVPLQGPAGIFGPSCEAVAATAVAQLNETGVLGREVTVELIDGGAPTDDVAADVRRAVDDGSVDAITGWHISAIRHGLAPVVADRVPYVYTSLYEGGERRHGIFCSGETPRQQIAPALRWLRDHHGLRRWFIVGDDYVWPRASVAATLEFAHELDLQVAGTAYVPLGSHDFAAVVDRVRASAAHGVLLYLVGQDAVRFNRAFAAAGLDADMARFTPLMEENMLLASGLGAVHNLFVSAAFFRSMATGGAIDLVGAYVAQHGADAPPLNNAAESCYEGIMTLAALARQADSLDVRRMVACSAGLGYDGPRGPMSMDRGHLRQPVHLAAADGYDFDVLASL